MICVCLQMLAANGVDVADRRRDTALEHLLKRLRYSWQLKCLKWKGVLTNLTKSPLFARF
jgi:hypothetical protein